MSAAALIGYTLRGPRKHFACGPANFLVAVFSNDRVSNRKSQSMQNEFVLVVSSRPTLETTLQIGYALGKVREKVILNHKPKYKKMAT